jgi:hypothetical protein
MHELLAFKRLIVQANDRAILTDSQAKTLATLATVGLNVLNNP